MDLNLRNLKDFLTLYNKVTELCFTRCVDNFNQRDLAKHEETCVTHCVKKFAAFNQSMMKVYVEVQLEMNQKRMQEIEDQKLIQQNQQPTTIVKTSTVTGAPSTEVTTALPKSSTLLV